MEDYKYQKVLDILRRDIHAKKWNPGEQIPSERELADQYQVSRITIKKAMQLLVADKTLERIPHKRGTFVHCLEEKQNETNLVGVAIDDVTDRFGSTLLRGIEDFLWKEGMHTIICNGDRDFKKTKAYFLSLLETNVSGVIYAPVISSEGDYVRQNQEIISLLQEKHVPFVLMDRTVPGMQANAVTSGHFESAYELTGFLLEHGYKRIILLTGLFCSSLDEREKGYLAAMHEHGITVSDKWIVRLNDNLLTPQLLDPEEIHKLSEALNSMPDYDAIVALNNRLLSALDVIVRDSISILPDNCAIALHDKLSVPLTRLRLFCQIVQPDYEVGQEAAQLLMRNIRDPHMLPRQIRLSSQLIPGDSV
ncbi:MAG: GntR family transcriptional regulator [Spirochaetia bacterium]|jgi:DNA-binding LacI/PurR family transcriptional regulator|nr:GntR family transcriptional regulator [Spirochaetia bacterium]